MEPVPFDEQESTVLIDYERKTAFVYSTYPWEYKRLKKIADAHPDETEITMMSDFAIEVAMPMSWVKIKPPAKRPDVMKRNEEQRRA